MITIMYRKTYNYNYDKYNYKFVNKLRTHAHSIIRSKIIHETLNLWPYGFSNPKIIKSLNKS